MSSISRTVLWWNIWFSPSIWKSSSEGEDTSLNFDAIDNEVTATNSTIHLLHSYIYYSLSDKQMLHCNVKLIILEIHLLTLQLVA